MYFRKTLHIFVLISLVLGGTVTPALADQPQGLKSTHNAAHFQGNPSASQAPTATYTVCAVGCDFSSIQAAIDFASDGDVIDLAAEAYIETITIDKSVDLIGEGAGSTFLQAAEGPYDAASRVITVTAGITSTIESVTIQYGYYPTYESIGGGIYNLGRLTLTQSTVATNGAYYGGGIYNVGELIFIQSTLEANEAYQGGGLYNQNGEINLTTVTVTNNLAAYGGGIFSQALTGAAPIRIADSVFSNNNADYDGGGLYDLGNGGLVTTVISQTTFSGNQAEIGGGLFIASSSGGAVDLQIYESIFDGNQAADEGGGIANRRSGMGTSSLEIYDSTFSHNTANIGGGMAVRSTGPNLEPIAVTIYNSTFSENTGYSDSAAVLNMGTSTMAVERSTFWGNYAPYFGGAITNITGDEGRNATLTVSNSTFSGNSTVYGGGAIMNMSNVVSENTARLQVINSTFADNAANQQGAGITNAAFDGSTAILNLANTILANDSPAGDCYNQNGTVIDGGYNLVEDGTCGFPVGGDPLLGPLADNGGDTLTHALLPGSPAIDAIPMGACAAPIDQRGLPRPMGQSCDVGAYEVAAGIFHVDAEAAGAYTGLTWTDAFTNPQDALAVATAGDLIWVADGVYYPDEGAGQVNDVVSSTFTLADGVRIFGGFDPGSGADEFLERDWETYITVLSGDLEQNDLTDPNGVVTTTDNIIGTNTYHVLSSRNVTGTTAIDGFAITAGQANGVDDYFCTQLCGGGMYNNNSNFESTNLIFSGNWAEAGGGMFNWSSSPMLNDVVFSGNSSGYYGGGMDNYENSNPQMNNVIFSGNSVTNYGGGLHNDGSSPTLTSVTFSDNTSGVMGGGIANEYGSSPLLTNVIFAGNSAIYEGGGMYNYSSNPTLIDVIFFANSTDWDGGGMRNRNNSSPTLINVTFSANIAGNRGGGILNGMSSPTLINVTFYDNSTLGEGGGIYNSGSSPDLRNTVLWGNDADGGGDQIHNYNSTPIISYGDIQDSGGSGAGWDESLGIDGGGNIDADPLFVNAPNGDLHLLPGSPAIDSGALDVCPPTDLDGVPRPQGFGCDMGAYEARTVSLRKLVGDPAPVPGQTINFTVQVSNATTETLTGGLISDTLPAGLNFLGPITLEPPLAGTVGTAPPTLVSNLTVLPSQRITVTFPVSVSYGLSAGTLITNTAALTAPQVLTPILGQVVVTVANAPPVAEDDAGAGFTTDEDTAFTTGNVLENDFDPNGGLLSVLSYDDSGLLGLLANNGDGTFDYDPNGGLDYLAQGEQALEIFTYIVSDGVLTDTALVNITVMGVNDAPVAVNDSGASFTTDEDTAFATGNVLDNDYDPDTSDLLSLLSYDDDSLLGLLTNNGDGTFDYDPNGQFEDLFPGEEAYDLFTYVVSDGVLTDTAVVTITIQGAYEPDTINLSKRVDDPTPAPGQAITFTIRVANLIPGTLSGGLISDTLPAGLNFLGPIVLEPPSAGTVGAAPPRLVTDLTILPGQEITVTFPVSVSYGLSAGTLITNTAALTASLVVIPILGQVEITIANAPPLAEDDAGAGFTTDEDTAFTTGSVLVNDFDPNGDLLSMLSYDDSNLLGVLTDNGDGTFDYDPNGQFEDLLPGEEAYDLFTYVVSDGVLTDTAVVTITVQGVNDAPLVEAGPDQTVDEGELVQYQGSASDPGLRHPSAVVGFHWDFGDGNTVTGTLTPTHTYADNGIFTVTLTVTDTQGGVANDWLWVTVENVAPLLSSFPDQEANVDEIITVIGTIADPGVLDSQTILIIWDDGITETLNLSTDQRQFTVTHAYAQSGEYTVSVRVTDKDGGWDEKGFLVTVANVIWQIYLPMIVR